MSDGYLIGLGNNDTDTRRRADKDYISFWNREAKGIRWFKDWDKTLDWQLPFARWFVGGTTNAAYNTLDIHQSTIPDKPAIIWETEGGQSRILLYSELFTRVKRFANVLKSLGVTRGDRVTIYMPMVPELAIAMLACARIGAVHTVIFSGFSATSIRDRVHDSGSEIIITSDGGYRRGKIVNLKDTVDTAIKDLDSVRCVVVLEYTGTPITMTLRDKLWSELESDVSDICPAEELDSNHPLFLLYTSGTTGKPKGVLHGTGGYLVHLCSTMHWTFDIQDSDIFFCTADLGWVAGHSYILYAPLLCGGTTLMYEGAPDFPDEKRIWEILERHRVTIFYTTPTTLRMFMKFGDDIPRSFNLDSLRLLGTVGEHINPEVWRWYYDVVGKNRCPIVDTWWQTETGGIIISPLPGLETIPLKPGSGTLPIPGIDVDIVDDDGRQVPPNTKGSLVIKNPWPGMLLTLWNDDQKYRDVYWTKYEDCYYPGDYALRDDDGYLWLLGRSDDVLKVAGHRIGTAEIESCLVSNDAVAEAAVCGISDEIKGEAIIAFVVLKHGISKTTALESELATDVRTAVGAIATLKQIYFVDTLPKTRSGKIMRRLLKAIASGETIGDTSTLEDGMAIDEVQKVFDNMKQSLGQC